MELGGILMAMRMKGETLDELLGFYQAVDKRVYKLPAPASGPRPVVIPTYNGARRQANLTPLIALWLKQFGFDDVDLNALNARFACVLTTVRIVIPPCKVTDDRFKMTK